MRADLIRCERYPVNLELEPAEQFAECLELAAGGYRHLPAGGVAVGEVEHHDRPVIGCGVAGDPVDERVAHLAGRQVQIRPVGAGDRGEHVGEAGLFADHDDPVRLDTAEFLDGQAWHELLGIWQIDVDPDRQVRPWVGAVVLADFRLRVALINDLVEGDLAEPPCGLCGIPLKPEPVLASVR